MSKFFVACPLGFEKELELEMKSFWFEMIDLDGQPTRHLFPECEILKGGVQLEVPEHLGFQINFFSKIAGRVLLRIGSFEARYYDQFEKAVAKIPLAKFLAPGTLKLKIESHKSRLNNEKNLTEAAAAALGKIQFKLAADAMQVLYFRIEKDRVLVSLDCTGEHLHRRGYAVYRGEAPLRETLAAYLIRILQKQTELDERLTIVDPFAGSGTILFEALSCYFPNLERDYNWLHFINAPKLFRSESWKKNYRWFEKRPLPQCRAYDIDPKAVENIEKNKLDFNKIFPMSRADFPVAAADSRQLSLDKLKPPVWIVTNPPYGIRLADDNAKLILENLENGIQGLIVIHPVNWKFRFKKLNPVLSQDFSNQGLNLKLSVFSEKKQEKKPAQ